MPSPFPRILLPLCLVSAFLTSLLSTPGGSTLRAQETDTEVPIVQVGGTVHADLFTGQATMSIPLEVLPGRQGVQPELALVYGSANGNGWVGMGWKLEKGVIERNLKFGVDYDTDDYVFRLNGVNVELVNIGRDEYRAKIEGSFTRIIKQSGAEGPYFEATDRYGTRYIFGETARVADPDDATRVFRWCLERVEDPNGNYMTFTFEPFEEDNLAYLKTIAYTGHESGNLEPATTVEFELEDRPDKPTLYTTHFPMTTSKRLKTIVIKAPSGEVMRSYQLAYHTTLSSSGRSLLQSMTQCGRTRANGDKTCLPPQTFTYTQPTGLTYSESLASLPFQRKSCEDNPPDPDCSGRTRVPQGPMGPSDVDGNGRLELLAFNDSTVIVSDPPTEADPDGTFPLDHMHCELSGPNVGAGAICTWNYDSTNSFPDIEFPEGTGYQWGPTTYLGSSDLVHGSMDYQLDEGPTAFADITGDGAMEVYQWTFDGGIDLHIPHLASDRRSLAGWSTVPEVLTWETFTAETPPKELGYRLGFADVDGDGHADFWGRQGTTVLVRLAHDYDPQTQTQTFAPAQAFLWADIGPLGNPMGFTDVNNDGRADFWGVRADEDLEIRLSQGDGTLGPPVIFPWVNDPLMNNPNPITRALRKAPPLGFADINGDGLADFWGWAPATKGSYVGGHLYYALGQGDGSFGAPDSLFWESPPPNGPLSNDPAVLRNPGGRLGFADLNGDGNADVYGWKHGDDHITYHFTQADGTVSDVAQTFSWSGSTPNAGPIGFADITGDGLPEFYGWTDAGWNGQINIVGVSEAKPDLLITVENGIGGRWDLSYASTGEPDLSGDQTQLPFTMPVVKAITVDDGNGNVGLITYAWTGGYYHIAERDFRGFHHARMIGPIHPDPYNPPKPSIEQETWFHQGNDVALDVNIPNVRDGYLKGAPYRQTVAGVHNRVMYSQTETIYTPDDDGPPFFTPPQSQETWTCGEDGLCRVMQTEFVYDAYGNLTQEFHYGDLAVSGDERTVQRTFVPNVGAWIVGLPASEIRYAGLGTGTRVAQTDFLYDGSSDSPTKGNLTQEVRWYDRGSDVTTVWTYDTLGNVLTIQDGQGSTTTRTYDASRTFVVTETNALGHTSQTAYYGVGGHPIDQGLYGQLKQVTDPNGNFTITTYDRLGRPEWVVHPDGLFTKTEYAGFGQRVGQQHVQTYHEVWNAPTDNPYPDSPWGVVSKQYFDGLGRVIQDEQPGSGLNAERITDIGYDYRGHVTSRSLPHFPINLNPTIPLPVITYETDALGRVVQATYPDTHVEKTCFAAGVTVTLDGNEHKTRTIRDVNGQVMTVQEYEGEYGDCSTEAGAPYSATAYTYDALGNLTKVTDAQGNETTMVYDSLSRQIQMDDPDMGRWAYAYNAVGNLTQQTDPKGQVIHLTYDALHRQVQKDYDTRKTPGNGDIVWGYDRPAEYGIGRLTTVTHHAATIPSATELWYDKRGRVAKKEETIGAHTFTTQMTYDGLDRETAITYPDGSVVQKTYTGQQLWRVEEGDGYRYAEITGYTPMAQPLLRLTGDGITTTYGYRSDNFRLQNLVSQGSATLQNLTYSYDNGGNVARITDPHHGDQVFVYDALNRLRRATVGGEVIHYTYSPIGNLLSHSRVGTYAYPPSGANSVRPHAVTTAGLYTYTYDDNGNLLTGANRTIEYDVDNRPIRITAQGYGGPPTPPSITTHPADRTVAKGGPATFSVSASGTAPLSYRWRRDGVDIAGAIGESYTLPSTTLEDSGAVFTVTVQNPAGEVTSAGATLTVLPTYTLTVTIAGTGSGTVTSAPGGISCGNDCTGAYGYDTVVTLTATSAAGTIFRGWSGGGCSGQGQCIVTMDKGHPVTATFGRLVGHWPLEGTATDASGNEHHGTLQYGPTTVAGKIDQALHFNGGFQHVTLPDGPLTANQAEVTLAFWVKPDVWTSQTAFYGEETTAAAQYVIYTDNWVTRDTSTGSAGPTENDVPVPNLSGQVGSWQHLAFVYSVSQSVKAVYLNGALVASTTVSIDPLTGGRDVITLGGQFLTLNFFQGALDEVRLYDYALTDAEIGVLAGTAPPTITTQPANVTVTEPNAATFSVVASGTAPLSYQWRREGANIGGATSANYTLSLTTTADSGATFDVVVSNTAGSVTSQPATVRVQVASPPTITTQPADVTVTAPNAATFTVTTTGTAPLNYQWQRWGKAISGATSASYTLTPTTTSDSGATFDVVVSNTAGSVTSTTAILTVEAEIDPPSITTQPLNVSLTEPAGAMFTVAATGTPPLNYQWRRNGVVIEGARYANYMVSSTTTSGSGDAIDVVVSNTAGSVTSVLVTLTVGPEPTRVLVPNVIGQAEATAESRLGGGGLLVGPITYQTSGSVPSGMVISQEPTADTEVPEGKSVDLMVSLGPIPPDPAGPPRIMRQPGDVKVEAPDGAIFRVKATGAEPLSYQWRRNGWNIEGATGGRYVFPTATGEDMGDTFEVVVSNAQGSVTSRVATLLVKSIPSAYFLTVTLAGTGNGTVTSDPAGINCGITCTYVFNSDTLVTLTATPSSFFDTFMGWSGGGCAGTLPCEVTMTQAKTVTATFNNWLFGATPLEEPGGSVHLVRSRPAGNSPSATPDAGQVVDAPRHTAYLHLAAFRPSAQTMPTGMEQVTEAEAAQQRQLKEVLVRTQAAPSEGTVTEFVYDGEGNRVIKQVDDWVTIYIGQHYVCHGTKYAVRNGGELACAKLIYANGQRVAMVQVDTGRATYFHTDHLGSSSVITDETGAVEQELAYYPFGATRVNTSSQNVDVAYKYTGQELDDTTGLYDYHARLYDPLIGRFIQPDTIIPGPFNPQALNRYSYVLNNPLRYIDPTGYSQSLPPNTLTLEQTIFDPILPQPQWLIAPCCTFNAGISPVSEATLNLLLSPPPAQILFPQLNNVQSSPLFEFNLFGQKIDVGVSASLVGVNVGNDLEGLSQSNFSLSVIAGISIGAGIDIRINPPSDDDFFVSPFVGFGKNLSIGTNLLKDPVTGADLGLQGLNISIGPSTGLPVGVQIPTIVNGSCKCN